MKILLVSDIEEACLYERFTPAPFEGVSFVISCGDLKGAYLSFLTTMLRVPVFYVHGNHDAGYYSAPPEGCDSLEDRVIHCNGLRLLGLGGCKSPAPRPFHYTEKQMQSRIRRARRAIARAGGVDILVAHAPAFGVGDSPGTFHEGFEAFLPLIDAHKPLYFVHGHQHLNYNTRIPRIAARGTTQIINAFGHHIITV